MEHSDAARWTPPDQVLDSLPVPTQGKQFSAVGSVWVLGF